MKRPMKFVWMMALLVVPMASFAQSQRPAGSSPLLSAGVIRLLPDMREHGLLLRSSPGYNASISANIAEGAPVLVVQRKGGWSGVLFAPGVTAGDLPRVCAGAGAPSTGAANTGPCRLGWAENRFIQPR